MDLHGTRALVTGASRGIGEAVARALAAEGVAVAMAARDADRLEAVAGAIAERGDRRPLVLTGDLSKRGEAERLGGEAVSRLGGLDILVNNAGVLLACPQALAGDDDAVRDLFEVNLWSPLALVRVLLPVIKQGGRGAIVNVSSMGAIAPVPLTAHYAASKAALSSCTTSLRRELRDSGVSVVHVLPGFVETPMLGWWRSKVPGGARLVQRVPVGRPDACARQIVAALRRGRHTVAYPLATGIGRFTPGITRVLTAWLARSMDPSHPALIR
jgi:short-subunit dehydrogenase